MEEKKGKGSAEIIDIIEKGALAFAMNSAVSFFVEKEDELERKYVANDLDKLAYKEAKNKLEFVQPDLNLLEGDKNLFEILDVVEKKFPYKCLCNMKKDYRITTSIS